MSEVAVWAPLPESVSLVVAPPGGTGGSSRVEFEMERSADGWWTIDVAEARPGNDYGFSLDGGPLRADPRSRWQPYGLDGPSRFWHDGQLWEDGAWQGRGLKHAVFYELHVGTFTEEGTLDSAIARLDHLVTLGITHVELLPLNDFDGEWNWGYDGVLWWAVHEAYGGPDALHRFVNACHRFGLAVCLDVVYNHLGPGANHLGEFGPYLKEGSSTWGPLINLDGEGSRGVRDHIIENALMWLGEFHIDALRLDAVHALVDTSPLHLLAELSTRVDELEASLGRPLVLVAESDLNDPMVISDLTSSGWGVDAQWDDDIHHALHALLTGERQGYYVDFGPLSVLERVFRRAFLHDRTYSRFRGRIHGRPVPMSTSTCRFVGFLQDHDQVGNRAAGDRLTALIAPDLLALGAVLLLTSPFTPMLFMGEEWGAATPWPFFTSHLDPELAAKVSGGRTAEFEAHGWDLSRVPDPQDPATFFDAKLDWSEPDSDWHSELLGLYRQLIELRHEHPELAEGSLADVDVTVDEKLRTVKLVRGELTVLANLSDEAVSIPARVGDVLIATGQVGVLGAGFRLAARTAAVTLAKAE